MTTDDFTTSPISADLVTPGIWLQVAGESPLEVESVDRRDPNKTEVFFKPPADPQVDKNYCTAVTVHPTFVFVRYQKN